MGEHKTYIAFLKGINVGGHHKVPMAKLRTAMEGLGLTGVQTLLNTGNVIFTGPARQVASLEDKIASQLESVFGFPIPTVIIEADDLMGLIAADPFKHVTTHGDIRLYVTFLKDEAANKPAMPYYSEDRSYRIIAVEGRVVCSVLDLTVSRTVKAMEILGKLFEADMTTRNWNTLKRIAAKLDAAAR